MAAARDVSGKVSPRPQGDVFDRLAEPVLAYAERLAVVTDEDLGGLLRHAGILLDRFAADAQRAGVVHTAIPPARYALALIVDFKARSNRALDVRVWAAGAHRHLFDGRDITIATLREFARKASEAGPEYEGVRRFLETSLAQMEGQRRRFEARKGTSSLGLVMLLIGGFALAVLGWASYVEWRYHHDLTKVFNAEVLQIGLDRVGDLPDLAQRLDQLQAASARVRQEREKAPLTLFAGILGFDAAHRAEAAYLAAVEQHVPPVLARGVDLAIASDGNPASLYDTLRAWSILSGQADWAPDYLAGWSADQAQGNPALTGIAPHVARLTPPEAALPQPDPELLAQATGFAAEADEADRAFLELRRSGAVARLPEWKPVTAIEGLADVMRRRSALPITTPIPGLFTAQGWDYARDYGAGIAVQMARQEAARLFPQGAATRNETPDLIMDILQRETLARWSAFLDDLRVRPFTDRDVSVLVSGRLALAGSPLERLLREIWAQSGGNDRNRSHNQQLSVAAEFAAMIQYVEQGRMAQISEVFASLNVALGATDRDKDKGQRRLMSIQDQARSVAALQAAPRVVVQIVEDTLAQTGASHTDVLSNPLTKAWQTEALQACMAATQGRFPFTDGPDADLAEIERVLGPNGMVNRFYRTRAQTLLDTSEIPWRWKPEARFQGLMPESALFFQKAVTLSAGLFGADGRIGSALLLTALAERGQSYMTIGGQGGPVQATSDSLRLLWPGEAPEKGIDVSFVTPEGEARIANEGGWGLLRLLAPLRLRERDGGRRFLVDLRSGGARLFLEIGFEREANPLSVRHLLKGFACPPVL